MNQGLDEGLREPITPKGLEKGRPGHTIKSLVKIDIEVVSTTSAILQGVRDSIRVRVNVRLTLVLGRDGRGGGHRGVIPAITALGEVTITPKRVRVTMAGGGVTAGNEGDHAAGS